MCVCGGPQCFSCIGAERHLIWGTRCFLTGDNGSECMADKFLLSLPSVHLPSPLHRLSAHIIVFFPVTLQGHWQSHVWTSVFSSRPSNAIRFSSPSLTYLSFSVDLNKQTEALLVNLTILIHQSPSWHHTWLTLHTDAYLVKKSCVSVDQCRDSADLFFSSPCRGIWPLWKFLSLIFYFSLRTISHIVSTAWLQQT